ncbi:glycine cleavage system protein GcvH [Neomoorella thermoacetica]|uniref:Glycine cleavage system H protein n=2 Tax=Neomoorella thermoacetica TaxID=1525 RepID=A0A1J5K1W9_NEOTH|nr:glycine cleavage system protein GcvH [Moorella thermoacetica]OIQ09189.1 glycine cleavage system H protein [Moorella thermoacetica]OIQ10775.1 glycine cleavage system H protein [Moorella thermoacetica]GAF25445.1 glycine cleavage system H protein [Moorella thermoacetica Y72]
MTAKYVILPCNGLDKEAGCLARELALKMAAATGSEIICPVLYQTAPSRYASLLREGSLVVIDGCATRCASRIAANNNLKIYRKITMTEEAKKRDYNPGPDWRVGAGAAAFVEDVWRSWQPVLREQEAGRAPGENAGLFAGPLEYAIHRHDKFIFRVPLEGFYFNENDCWVQVEGNRGRVGISDYLQQNLSDITFVTPPDPGTEVEQFGEMGTIESAKAVYELVSPVTGRVVAVNEAILEAPELINENPYEKGWIAELELTNFEADREFLLDGRRYMEVLKEKVADFNAGK